MAFEKLNERAQKVVLQVMKLIYIEKRYIPDWEIGIRMGVTRAELFQVIESWPNLTDDNDEDEKQLTNMRAINNSLNEALNGVTISNKVWHKWISEPRDEVARIYQMWTAYRERSHTT